MRKLMLAFSLLCAAKVSANPAMEGDWMIEVKPSGAAVIGLLEIERADDGWLAFVEGGPAPIEVDGNQVAVDIDTRDIRGFVIVLKLEGQLDDDRLSGSYTVQSDAEVSFTPGTWSAVRFVEEDLNRR